MVFNNSIKYHNLNFKTNIKLKSNRTLLLNIINWNLTIFNGIVIYENLYKLRYKQKKNSNF